jgi:hypothetical protein
MMTPPLILVLPDGIRLYVREPQGVPREGDHVMAVGAYYRVKAVVWQFGREIRGRDPTVPAMATEIHLELAMAPSDVEGNPLKRDPGVP